MNTAYAVAHLRTPTLNEDVVEYLERIQDTMDPFGGRFAVHVPNLESVRARGRARSSS